MQPNFIFRTDLSFPCSLEILTPDKKIVFHLQCDHWRQYDYSFNQQLETDFTALVLHLGYKHFKGVGGHLLFLIIVWTWTETSRWHGNATSV